MDIRDRNPMVGTLVEMKREQGAASMKVDLRNSIITVRHGVDDDVLFACKAYSGDWTKLWTFIRSLDRDTV